MQIKKNITLISNGNFASSLDAQAALAEITAAILAMVWPTGATTFNLNSQKQGNGVGPVKDAFVEALKAQSWIGEHRVGLDGQKRPGPLDAVKIFSNGEKFAVEWETGNISSSHRALNKMAVCMMQGHIKGGVLILPNRDMAKLFTDRIGNFEEIEPYFPIWQTWPSLEGILGIFVIEHDGTDDTIPVIKKLTSGHALLRASKLLSAKKSAVAKKAAIPKKATVAKKAVVAKKVLSQTEIDF